jgi:hypothetical protein
MACNGAALALFIFVERVKVFYYIIHILFAWNRSSWSGGSPASNAGGPGLKSWSGHRLSWLKFFLGFPQALQAVAVIVPQATAASSQILSNSSSTYHPFIRRHIVSFAEKALNNKLQINIRMILCHALVSFKGPSAVTRLAFCDTEMQHIKALPRCKQWLTPFLQLLVTQLGQHVHSFTGAYSPGRTFGLRFRCFLITHIQTHGRTPPDEWSARRRDRCLHRTTQHTNTSDKHPCP